MVIVGQGRYLPQVIKVFEPNILKNISPSRLSPQKSFYKIDHWSKNVAKMSTVSKEEEDSPGRINFQIYYPVYFSRNLFGKYFVKKGEGVRKKERERMRERGNERDVV